MVTDWTNTYIFVTHNDFKQGNRPEIGENNFSQYPILIETGKRLKIGDTSYKDLMDNSLVDYDLSFQPVKSSTSLILIPIKEKCC